MFAVLAVALVPLSLTARQSPLVNGGEALGSIPFSAVGVVIARRLPRNPIGWLFFGIAACLLLFIVWAVGRQVVAWRRASGEMA